MCLVGAVTGTESWGQEQFIPDRELTRWVDIDGLKEVQAEAPEPGGPFVAQMAVPLESGAKAGMPRVLIVVEHNLYAQIGSAVSSLATALGMDGYVTGVFDFAGGTAEDLRATLISLYNEPDSLDGAIFIGDLPHVVFEMICWKGSDDEGYASFPCDLFFMDMNGTWSDTLTEGLVQPGNGKYDTWSGNQSIEIWMGRIPTHKFASLGTEAELATSYIKRNREHRTASATYPYGLSFADDDWAHAGPPDQGSLNAIYGASYTTGYSEKLATSRDNYMLELPRAHQIIYLRCHGSPSGHSFTPGGSVSSATDYRNAAPPARFYHLFVCSGNNYLHNDYLGGMCILNPAGGGVLSWGSSKTGGMLSEGSFYEQLAAGACFGDAFRYWFNRFSHDNAFASWEYGMTMAGDPSLKPKTLYNDSFDNRCAVGDSRGSMYANNSNATLQPGEPAHAIGTHGKSLWWTWRAPSSGRVYFDTFGSAFDTALAVYTGTSALSLVARNDNSNGTSQSELSFVATSGTYYQIAVVGRDTTGIVESGTIKLNWELLAAPANDNFGSAIAITNQSGSETGNTRGATEQSGEPEHAGSSNGRSIWYNYQWNQAGTAMVTMDTIGSEFDTVLAVYTGSTVSALTPVTSNNNIDGTTTASRVSFMATAGVTYRIAVDGTGENEGGAITLRWSAAKADAADNFASKGIVGGMSGTSVGSTVGATKETGEPNHAGNLGGKSIWWEFWAPNDLIGGYGTKVTISTAGSDFNTTLAVYRGSSLATLQLVASNNDYNGTPQSQVSFNMDYDQYVIAVDGYRSGGVTPSGNVVLTWNVNDAFADRLALAPANGGLQDGENRGASREVGEPRHGGKPGAHSVWFRWTAPRSASVLFSYQGFSNPGLGAYTGSSIATLDEVDYTTRSGASMRFCATSGTEYQIAVDGLNTGTFQIQWSMDDTPKHLKTSIETGYGRIRVNGVNQGSSYEADYSICEVVTLKAEPTTPNWSFMNWSGDIESDEATIQVPMGKDMEIFAHYKRDKYMLNVACQTAGDLYVNGTWRGSEYSDYFAAGTEFELRAEAAPGFVFSHWGNAVSSTDETINVTVTDTTYIRAYFDQIHTTTLSAAKDATLYNDAQGDVANGSGQTIVVGGTGSGVRRGLVQFDVASSLPENADVLSANLRMYHSLKPDTGAVSVSLVKAGQSWGEGASDAPDDELAGTTAQSGDATWLHRFFSKTLWSTPGGATTGGASATISVGSSGSYTFDRVAPGTSDALLVADVQGWLDDPAQNFGWMVKTNEAAATIKRFSSRQNANAAVRPQLSVTYSRYEEREDCYRAISSDDVPLTVAASSSNDSSLMIPDSFTLADVNVQVTLDTDYIDGISLYLYSPDGTMVTLVENVSAVGSLFDGTGFNDEAVPSIQAGEDPFTGSYRPDLPLSAFDGEDAQGEWILSVENTNGYRAVLSHWSLCLTPVGGEVEVVVEPDVATWTLSGPTAFTGNGQTFTGDQTFTGLPEGYYTWTGRSVEGYGTPAAQKLWLSNGQSIQFYKPYIAPVSVTVDPLSITGYTTGEHFPLTATVAGGYPPYTYRWTRAGVEMGTGSTLDILGGSVSESGWYKVTVTDDHGGTAESAPVSVRFAEYLKFTTQPQAGKKYTGDPLTLSAVITGGHLPLSYSWRKGVTEIGTSPAYTKSSLAPADTGWYSVVVSDSYTDTCSSVSTSLTVRGHVVISTQPTGANKYIGGAHTFQVSANGGYIPFTYTWKKGNTIVGTGPLLELTNLQATDAGRYTAYVTDTNTDNVPSATVTLSVKARVLFTAMPQGANVAPGASYTLTAGVNGGYPPYSYTWQKGTTIVGHDPTYTIAAMKATDQGWYSVTVRDTYGDTRRSAAARVGLKSAKDGRGATKAENPLQITKQPEGGGALAGETLTLSVETTGGVAPIEYTWKKNDAVVGEGATLLLGNVMPSDSGDYTVEIGDGSGQILVSDTARLEVSSEGVPAAGLAGLALLALGIVGAARRKIRRR